MREPLPDRMLRWLVAGYPKATQAEYGQEILATCRARRLALGREASTLEIVRFWVREFLGLIRDARRARREEGVGALRTRPRIQFGRLLAECRVSFRRLRRRPSLALFAILVLSLGIGVNGAMAGVGWRALWGRLSFPESDRLVRLFHSDDLTFGVSLNELQHYRAFAGSFEDVAGWQVADATFLSPEGPVRIGVARVTPNFLSVLRRRPVLGRDFASNGGLPEVLLSYALWARSFRESALDSTVELNGRRFRVAGVLPEDLLFPDPEIEIFLPVDFSAPPRPGRGSVFLDAIARLAPESSLDTAQSEASLLAGQLRLANPAAYAAEHRFGAFLVPFQDQLVAGHRPLLIVLVVAAGLVLVTTCLNVSLLMLAEVQARTSEIGVRRALGASTLDLARGVAAEGAIIAVAGAAAGGLVATWTFAALKEVVPVWLWVHDPAGGLLGPIVGGALFCGLFLAVAPLPLVIRSRRLGSNRHTPEWSTGSRIVRSLQAAVAVVLVSGALLLTATARNLAAVELGYRIEDVLTARITLPPSYTEAAAGNFFARLIAEIEGSRGVQGAGIVNVLPLSGLGGSGDVFLEAVDSSTPVDVVAQRLASQGYFRAIGIPLLEGRLFSDEDRSGTRRVAVVDEAFARQYFGGPSRAVGQRLRAFLGGPEWNTIIGVVGSVRHTAPQSAAGPLVYFPVSQRATRGAHLVIHFDGEADDVNRLVRETALGLDAKLPVYDVATMATRLRGVTSRNRFALKLFGGFSALATLLAALGIFGAVRLTQLRRGREVGIRRALGAPSGHIVWTMTRPALFTGLAGVAIGLIAVRGLAGQLENLLFGVSAWDPLVMAAAAALVFLIGAAAAILPVLRWLHPDLAALVKSG